MFPELPIPKQNFTLKAVTNRS